MDTHTLLKNSPDATKDLLSVGAVFPATAPIETLPDFARTVESAGLDELWVVEDCFLSGGLTMAATALAVTAKIKVGIGLLPAMMRNPALTAMEVGGLARLHPRRLTVAIGHGVPSWMAQIGAVPDRRITALREVVASIRALLHGETVTLAGTAVKLDSVGLQNPPPVAPPVIVGTTGPRGLRLAADHADGFLLPEGCGPRFVEWARETAVSDTGNPTPLSLTPAVGEGASGRRDPAPDRVVYAWAHIDEDVDVARAELEPRIRDWITGGLYPEAYRRAGIADTAAEIDFARLADELTVHGPAEACVEAMRAFRAAGATRLIMVPVGAEAEVQVERLGAALGPAPWRAER